MEIRLVLLLLLVNVIFAKTLWGARKRKEDSIENEGSDFIYKRTAPPSSDRRIVRPKSTQKLDGKSSEDARDAIKNLKGMIDVILQGLDDLVVSDRFEEVFSPSQIQRVLDMFPQLSGIPEVQSALGEISNPDKMREVVSQGVIMARAYLSEVNELLDSPDKLRELLRELPPEISTVFEALLTGDIEPLKALLSSMPGVEASHRQLLLDLLDGKMSNVQAQLAESLSSHSKIEELRRQLMQSPEALEALGMDIETLSNPDRFAEMMKESMDSLIDLMGDSEATNAKKARMHAA